MRSENEGWKNELARMNRENVAIQKEMDQARKIIAQLEKVKLFFVTIFDCFSRSAKIGPESRRKWRKK